MIHFAYPNVKYNEDIKAYEFIGCGRFAVFEADTEPAGYDTHFTQYPNEMTVVADAALLLTPEKATRNRLIYEIQDEPEQVYTGKSLMLAYLLADINRKRELRGDLPNGDIWSTGEIDLTGAGPILKAVKPKAFEVKLKAFLSERNQDTLFIVPDANIELDHQIRLNIEYLEDVRDVSLDEFSPHDLSTGKTILRVGGDELPQLVKLLFKPRHTNIRRLITNLILGVSVFFVMLFLQHTVGLPLNQDDLMSFAMKILEGQALSGKHEIPSLVFLDIDQKTHEAWGGQELWNYRDRLLQLVQTVISEEPQVLLIDVFFEQSGIRQHNQAFLKYLSAYPNDCRKKFGVPKERIHCPQIILAQNVEETPSEKGCFEIRPSFLDKVVKSFQEDVYWGTAQALMLGDESVVRRFPLWMSVCGENEIVRQFPSMPLLTMIFVEHQNLKPHEIQDSMREIHSRLRLHPDKPLDVDTLSFSFRRVQRIWYAIPPEPPYSQNPDYSKLSAEEYLKWAEQDAPASNKTRQTASSRFDVSGKIVIIGESLKDVKPTPLGEMPGSLILLNTIHSLLRYGEFRPLAFPVKLLVEIVLLVVMSVAFIRFHSVRGILLTGLLTVMSIFPLVIVAYKYGFWVELDFFAPLFVVLLWQMISAFNTRRFRNHKLNK